MLPREVYREVCSQDYDIFEWIKEQPEHVIEPTVEVQRDAGEIYAMLPNPGLRDAADPFVVAEAKVRGFAVVTYEGRSFSGIPTKNWAKTTPGICQRLEVPCRTLPEALTALGGAF